MKRAWQVCFDDPQAFIDWNFEKNFSYRDTLIAESDGVSASNLQLMPHRIRLGRFAYDINYVSGVATLPEFRYRGLVRELFDFAFPVMQKRHQPISLLVPFNYEFYEKFGYKQCYEKVFRHAEHLPEGAYLTAKDLSPVLIARLNGIYVADMECRSGYALRTQLDWQKILEDLLLLSEGRIWLGEQGYALITPREEGGWEIHEVCGNCELAYEEDTKPFAMARIIDPVRVLTDLAQDFDGCVRLKLTDANIAENNLTVQIAKGTVTPCTEFDWQLDVKDLAPLVFGFGEDWTHSGLFSKQNPYLNMIF